MDDAIRVIRLSMWSPEIMVVALCRRVVDPRTKRRVPCQPCRRFRPESAINVTILGSSVWTYRPANKSTGRSWYLHAIATCVNALRVRRTCFQVPAT